MTCTQDVEEGEWSRRNVVSLSGLMKISRDARFGYHEAHNLLNEIRLAFNLDGLPFLVRRVLGALSAQCSPGARILKCEIKHLLDAQRRSPCYLHKVESNLD